MKYGIWNAVKKEWQFPSIKEDSEQQARNKLHKLIGHDAKKWRFEIKPIPSTKPTKDHMVHNMIEQTLIDEDVYFCWVTENGVEILCIEDTHFETYKKFDKYVTIRAVPLPITKED